MSEVNRYEFVYVNDFGNEYPAFPRLEVNGDYVTFENFDRVTAERDATQQRLTAADERADVLEGLLLSAEVVIDQFMPNVGKCFGIDFLRLNDTLAAIKAALKPAEGGGDEG